MDIQAKIQEVVAKIQADPQFAERFMQDPMDAVKNLIGGGLPDDAVQQIVEGAKGMLAGGQAGNLLGKVGKFF